MRIHAMRVARYGKVGVICDQRTTPPTRVLRQVVFPPRRSHTRRGPSRSSVYYAITVILSPFGKVCLLYMTNAGPPEGYDDSPCGSCLYVRFPVIRPYTALT